ncbi:MAG TPA: inorganic diphosphatase [Thermodesulfobacteriota bacterium]|nr:inorganic diphosphatase [Thermodesulfobacteriota bacterium]
MFTIKVFIENEAHSNRKNTFNEKTLEYVGTAAITGEYPFAYGFILNTTGMDGDNVDCFVITEKPLKSGELVDCEPIGLMEQMETSWEHPEEVEEDHKVLAALAGESAVIDQTVKAMMRKYVPHIFDHIPGKKIVLGEFRDKESAIQYIQGRRDKS